MTRYEFALEAHSTLRLVLTASCGFLFLVGGYGWMRRAGPIFANRLLVRIATILADVQLLLGLALYFWLSPWTQQARANFGAAMKDPTLRFWAVEHGSAMLLAIASIHIGKVLSGKAKDETARHRRTAIWFGIAFALFLAMSPWPFSGVPRDVWRLGAP